MLKKIIGICLCFLSLVSLDAVEKIIVRDAKFYTQNSNERFVPVGFNYTRLSPHPANSDVLWHETFADYRYNRKEIVDMMETLKKNKFNVVRVFIDHVHERGCVENFDSKNFRKSYMDNVIDFLRISQENDIRVIFAMVWMPHCKMTTENGNWICGDINEMNARYLCKAKVLGKKAYLENFTRYLKENAAEYFNSIFAIEIDNEDNFTILPPFDGKTKSFEAPNGKTYKIENDEDAQNLADDAAKFYADEMVEAVRKMDKDVLVSTSMFTFSVVGRSGPGKIFTDKSPDKRFPIRPLALVESKLSYIDIHFYPRSRDDSINEMNSIEIDVLKSRASANNKPVIVGEIGIFAPAFFNEEKVGEWFKNVFTPIVKEGFDGYLWWTYDTWEQPEWWTAKRKNGAIFQKMTKELISAQKQSFAK